MGTIEKIARRVANIEIDRDVENKWTTLTVGNGGDEFTNPVPLLLTTKGMFDSVSGIDVSNSFFAPNTALEQVQAGGLPKAVVSGESYRQGDEVTVTGLSFKGLLKLPELTSHALITIKIVKFAAPLQQLPYKYFTSLKYTGIRRDLVEPMRATVVKSMTVNLNHRAYSRDVTRMVDMYVPLNDKKIRYKEHARLLNPLDCAIADFQDEFYMLVAFSSASHPSGAGFPSPIPTAQANLFPHLHGRFVCYYKDS